ncbi:MAG: hypothetical protein PF444_02950, partial [Bacteroidales bacterium]|nr:hypothetical protein [Bacteroidales bacterium]
MKKIEKSSLILFLAYWLFVGFPLGLFTLLMGPAKWVISLSEHYNWSESLEGTMQKLVIVLFVIVSFMVAFWFKKGHASYKSKKIRWGIFSALTLNFLFAVYMFSFYPEKLINLSDSVEITTLGKGTSIEFVFGGYPDEDKLKELKDDGFTAVITLMSNLVIPAEPKLIKEEKKATEEISLALIHIPMLPWVSENTESLRQIDSLATKGKGKYYVHCYLGRDRVNVFKNIVKRSNENVAVKDESKIRTVRKL